MKHGSTFFLRGVIFFLGLAVLTLCLFTIFQFDNAGYYLPILIGMNITALPFFFALYQALDLLSYIDENKAFSTLSIQSLKNIKYSALIIAGLYTIGMPYIYLASEKDDAPGVIAIGLIFILASIVIATFAAVLQKLLEDAIAIKSENELTV